MADRTVVFVCPHGAGKSRIAAAWFNATAPPGWCATSAGIEPQAEVSAHAPPLLAGTEAEQLLDQTPPRGMADVPGAALIVGIDCSGDQVPGALSWQLENREFRPAMAEEIRVLVRELARDLTNGMLS